MRVGGWPPGSPGTIVEICSPKQVVMAAAVANVSFPDGLALVDITGPENA